MYTFPDTHYSLGLRLPVCAEAEPPVSDRVPFDVEMQALLAAHACAPDTDEEMQRLLDKHLAFLSPRQHDILLALTVFDAGWSVAAAIQVCCEPLAARYCRELSALGLLRLDALDPADAWQGADEDDTLRGAFLGPARAALLSRLHPADADAIRQRYVAYFAGMAHQAASWMRQVHDDIWMRRLGADIGNMKAAIRMAGQDGLDMLTCVWRWWLYRGQYSEGVTLLAWALFHNKTAPTRCIALRGMAVLLRRLKQPLAAAGYARLAASAAYAVGRRDVLAEALNDLGTLAMEQGQYDDASAYHLNSLHLMRELRDAWGEASACNGLGLVCWRKGDLTEAKDRFHMAGELFMQRKDKRAAAKALNNMSLCAEARKDYKAAAKGAAISAGVFRELGDMEMLTHALHNLGNAQAHLGRVEEGRKNLGECLSIMRGIGYCDYAPLVVANLAHAAFLQENHNDAVVLFAAAHALRHRYPISLPAATTHAFAAIEAKVKARVRPQAHGRLRRKGLTMTLDDTLAYLSLTQTGDDHARRNPDHH